jgi:uncharacterized protein (TIGR00369 family)
VKDGPEGARTGAEATAEASRALSGIQETLGFRIVEWRDGFAAVELDAGPALHNRDGVVHGGVIATLVDVVSGLCGCYCRVPGNTRTGATLAISTTFIAPVRSGRVRAVGRRLGGGRRIFSAEAQVVDEQGTLLASGHCTYRFNPGSENPEGVALRSRADDTSVSEVR